MTYYFSLSLHKWCHSHLRSTPKLFHYTFYIPLDFAPYSLFTPLPQFTSGFLYFFSVCFNSSRLLCMFHYSLHSIGPILVPTNRGKLRIEYSKAVSPSGHSSRKTVGQPKLVAIFSASRYAVHQAPCSTTWTATSSIEKRLRTHGFL